MRKSQMKLGLSMRYLGYHDAAWRHPDVPAGGATDFKYFLNSALIAQRGKFDMVFFADGIGVRADDNPPGSLARTNRNVELEPLTLLAALAPMTSHIGLVSTASTTYNEPYHIARKFASLDNISGGRAGWNIVTSWSEQEAWNFSREKHLDYDTRYDRAKEFVDVVTGLWDSWEDDAFIHDKASGQFYDPAKLHVLNHRGKHFQVRGPLSAPRTPQGRPILVQAGAAEQGQEIAAANADVVYAAQVDLAGAKAYYAGLKARMAKYGRATDLLKVMPAVTTIVGRTRAEARAKFDQLQELIDPMVGLANLFKSFGDLSGYPLDGPVPEPVDAPVRSIAYNMWHLAQRENMTIRQFYQHKSAGSGGLALHGTAEDIADVMEMWIAEEAADGFNLTPTHLPHGVSDFVDLVVPELQRRGSFRTEYEGTTLRENLGLPPNTNRHAAAAPSGLGDVGQ
ncbi:MAG TPA: LLM class flavin-dependent oxidoreductase [Aliidongia sp.]|uniref:LLM class flavin-dependent oxidoreductase n=1 Tax=Aliidongia sp. TaxID=1914230 RepID=UPI002DDC997B|nr:LLM class flavin-dependent oxidoreductase [Aliidongia sp.]HEV2674752.1 LLM class flavin-dependent oxidoreductase [Aliidongia sp.]